MPHAALWVVQQRARGKDSQANSVSMPHAALWVVQLLLSNCCKHHLICFNAARGFVGGAAESVPESYPCRTRFNAARGFVGGAAFVARSPCPPREKKPFWKVSGNLSVLTENM